MKKVIVICGPTASGKTKLSIELAKILQAEILNGDSVQLYRELNIGAAKIKLDEMKGIKHHLLNVTTLNKPYTVYHFQQEVRKVLETIELPMIVGGSGLYIKAALYNYEFEKYEKNEINVSLSEMIQTIQEKDPNLTLDLSNQRSIVSAYKQVLVGGKRSEKKLKDVPLYDVFLIYLDMPREILKRRVEERLNGMLKDGFMDEVKALLHQDLNFIGYREFKSYLLGQLSLEAAKEAIIKATMRFAKRQRTWFLRQMKPHSYDALSKTLLNDILVDVKRFLEG